MNTVNLIKSAKIKYIEFEMGDILQYLDDFFIFAAVDTYRSDSGPDEALFNAISLSKGQRYTTSQVKKDCSEYLQRLGFVKIGKCKISLEKIDD